MRIAAGILLGGMLLLAACDQKNDASVTVKDKDGSVTISANGQHFTVHGNDGTKGDVTISGNGGQVTVHAGDGKSVVDINTNGLSVGGKLPGFVSVYPGAKVVSMVAGNNQGGTLVLETKAAPAEVIGFYKQKAEGAGFTQTLNANDSGNMMYGATFAGRTVQVLASREGDGTHAQITWASQ